MKRSTVLKAAREAACGTVDFFYSGKNFDGEITLGKVPRMVDQLHEVYGDGLHSALILTGR